MSTPQNPFEIASPSWGRPAGFTWRDPRFHPASDLEGFLAETVEANDEFELAHVCGLAITHTFLEASPINRPDPEWVRGGHWIIVRPSPDASRVEIITRLVAGVDEATDRLAIDVVRELWDDPRFTIDQDVLGVFALTTVSAHPLVLADLASTILVALDTTSWIYESLAKRGFNFTFSSSLVDFQYHFCGTSLIAETGQYSDISENPIQHWGIDDE